MRFRILLATFLASAGIMAGAQAADGDTKAFSRPPPGQGSGPSSPNPAQPGPSAGTSSGWQRYGIWSFKLDSLAQGPDGHWQAVFSVRSESRDKVGLNATEIDAYLINADGEVLPEAGNLYKASVTGTAAGLEKLSGTQWMQQGDVVRVRLLFEGSAKFNPVTLRVKSSGGSPTVRNFPVGSRALASEQGGGGGTSLGDAADTVRQAADGVAKAKHILKAAKGLFR